jgi:formamidopyrimidine-DNA glycosylase
MPELPEVETVKRGIATHVENKIIQQVILRERRLRWEVPETLATILPGQRVETVTRRGKYLLLKCTLGHLLIHLGMSGRLLVVNPEIPLQKHDHVDFIFENNQCLRYHDPRRFGCILWTTEPTEQHPLLANLGMEPLENRAIGEHLFNIARKKDIAVKKFIMNNQVVVGIGNIYANESLFLAGIHPLRAVSSINLAEFQQLGIVIQQILTIAIAKGGTTLKDFTNSAGQAGYFQQELKIYGRAGEPCGQCGTIVQHIKIVQRPSYFCPHCQPVE